MVNESARAETAHAVRCCPLYIWIWETGILVERCWMARVEEERIDCTIQETFEIDLLKGHGEQNKYVVVADVGIGITGGGQWLEVRGEMRTMGRGLCVQQSALR